MGDRVPRPLAGILIAFLLLAAGTVSSITPADAAGGSCALSTDISRTGNVARYGGQLYRQYSIRYRYECWGSGVFSAKDPTKGEWIAGASIHKFNGSRKTTYTNNCGGTAGCFTVRKYLPAMGARVSVTQRLDGVLFGPDGGDRTHCRGTRRASTNGCDYTLRIYVPR